MNDWYICKRTADYKYVKFTAFNIQFDHLDLYGGFLDLTAVSSTRQSACLALDGVYPVSYMYESHFLYGSTVLRNEISNLIR